MSRRPLVPLVVLAALVTPATSESAGGRYHAGEIVQDIKLHDGENWALGSGSATCSRDIITLTAAKSVIGRDTYATVFRPVDVGIKVLHSFGRIRQPITTWAFVFDAPSPVTFDVDAGGGHKGLPSYTVTVDCVLTAQGASAWNLGQQLLH